MTPKRCLLVFCLALWTLDFLANAQTTGTRTMREEWTEKLRERAAEYQPLLQGVGKRSAEELEKLQQWEYNVVQVNTADPARLTDELNRWGKEGWECYHIVSAAPKAPGQLPDEHLLFLRKRPRSWFGQIPYREFLKMMNLLSADEEGP